jgi:hypothetical protein
MVFEAGGKYPPMIVATLAPSSVEEVSRYSGVSTEKLFSKSEPAEQYKIKQVFQLFCRLGSNSRGNVGTTSASPGIMLYSLIFEKWVTCADFFCSEKPAFPGNKVFRRVDLEWKLCVFHHVIQCSLPLHD